MTWFRWLQQPPSARTRRLALRAGGTAAAAPLAFFAMFGLATRWCFCAVDGLGLAPPPFQLPDFFVKLIPIMSFPAGYLGIEWSPRLPDWAPSALQSPLEDIALVLYVLVNAAAGFGLAYGVVRLTGLLVRARRQSAPSPPAA